MDNKTAKKLLDLNNEMVDEDSEDGKLLLQYCSIDDQSNIDFILDNVRVHES
ncbi:hypothetical protein [Belliella pelovolcani]|uniref:hypothetical protein n=1 Tax=Belliella pelovolcani TaxID=529505 RepID=UPI00391C4D81